MKQLNWFSKRSFNFSIFFILILVSVVASSCAARNIESEILALKNADVNWPEACASKNVDRLLDFYDADACNINPQGNVHRGMDELKKLWTNEFSGLDYS